MRIGAVNLKLSIVKCKLPVYRCKLPVYSRLQWITADYNGLQQITGVNCQLTADYTRAKNRQIMMEFGSRTK